MLKTRADFVVVSLVFTFFAIVAFHVTVDGFIVSLPVISQLIAGCSTSLQVFTVLFLCFLVVGCMREVKIIFWGESSALSVLQSSWRDGLVSQASKLLRETTTCHMQVTC